MVITALYDLARDVLDVVVAGFSAAGVDLPARQYVQAGEVAIDCEQVVVEIGRVFLGLPGQEVASGLKCCPPRSVSVVIWISRCVPTMADDGSTDPDALDASSLAILTDGAVLLGTIIEAWKDGTLLSLCDSIAFQGMTPVGPEGGFGGFRLDFQAQL